MTTTLANQLPRINLANGGSMQSAQVVTVKCGQQNASSVDSKSPMQSLSFAQAQHYRAALVWRSTELQHDLSQHVTGSQALVRLGSLRQREHHCDRHFELAGFH